MKSQKRYRRDIQALRGLAVLAVVLFHANENIFPLGYLGVDVFFVISGFVVTPLILRIFAEPSIKKRYINLKIFFKHRFYRLAPALAFILMVSAVVIMLFGDPNDHIRFARQGITTLFLIGNIGAYKYSGDYFSPNPNPLIHTWSLSVEEQIYIFLPLVFFLILYKCSNTKKFFKFIFILITVVSFFYFYYSSYLESLYTLLDIQLTSLVEFYSPVTRIWQFTLGGLGYLFMPNFVNNKHSVFKYINLTLLIVMTILLLSQIQISFKNSATATTFCSLLVLMFRTFDSLPNYIGNKLEWLGDRSYSIYLVHMPILYIAKYSVVTAIGDGQNRAAQIILGVFVSIFFGALSFSKIENRFRYALIPSSQTAKIKLFTMLFTFVLPIMFFLFIEVGRKNNYWMPVKYAMSLTEASTQDSNCNLESEFIPYCSYGESTLAKRVLLVGDSHANHFAHPLGVAAANQNWTSMLWTQSGCVLQFESNYGKQVTKDCLEINNRMLSWVIKNKPDLIIVSQYIQKDFSQFDLQNALLKLKLHVPNILVIGNNPIFPDDPSNLPLIFRLLQKVPATQVPISYMNYRDKESSDELIEWAKSNGISTLNLWPLYCDEAKCIRYLNSKWLYADSHHLTIAGASLAIPEFEFYLKRYR